MSELHIYKEDLQIAKALINRDERMTRRYLYKQCYPLFYFFYDNYYTDCDCCKEFIDEIYLVVLTPSAISGKCQMDNYKGESSLSTWLRTVCLFYCYKKYRKKPPTATLRPLKPDKEDNNPDRWIDKGDSISIDFDTLNKSDIEALLKLMPNQNYSLLIRCHYIEHLSNKETADILNVTMSNYYNMKVRAKEQWGQVCRKEESYGHK